MQSWHESIVQAIELGKKEGEFKNISNSTDIAWRLIAFCVRIRRYLSTWITRFS